MRIRGWGGQGGEKKAGEGEDPTQEPEQATPPTGLTGNKEKKGGEEGKMRGSRGQ